VPDTGGAPRLLRAEHTFPSPSGYVGIALPGIFLIYLVAFLFASAILAALRHALTTAGTPAG
jgi:hypothetical protein